MHDPKDEFFGPDPDDKEDWDKHSGDSVFEGDYNDPDRDDGMNADSFPEEEDD